MKFLVTNYSWPQNPWLVGYRPQIPVLSVLCPQLNFLNPSLSTKFLGTPLVLINSELVNRKDPCTKQNSDWWTRIVSKKYPVGEIGSLAKEDNLLNVEGYKSVLFCCTIHRSESGSQQTARWIVFPDPFIQQRHIATDRIFQLWHSAMGNSYASKTWIQHTIYKRFLFNPYPANVENMVSS